MANRLGPEMTAKLYNKLQEFEPVSMNFGFVVGLTFFLMLLSPCSIVSGFELKSQYTTIYYEQEDLLRQFDSKVSFGRISYLLHNKTSTTTEDEVKNKVDVLIERVEAILDMHPDDFRIRIVILPTTSDIKKAIKATSAQEADLVAFYTPRGKTVYVSVSDIRLGVLAHEFGHAVVDSYFVVGPPPKIHEVMAQYVEIHLYD
jgi:Zn-dependent protease with chaperone function